ncbi:MAG: hypothetical protein LQ346_000859 [Caloplaca aetnensis]|nr:MAG: hypothetical protein LQ346_000859 [Caloplaca aetnensis]
MAALVSRIWSAFNPPQPPKSNEALRFGILGAANIAPLALIGPAKSHPEVIIQAVAARDHQKAATFAKANGIPEVKNSYQEMLDDPNIDCIFIPLPNGLHYEWAVRSIRAGKHVLLEKPSVSNSTEAEILFNLPELSNGPVLLEAFHNRFYPAWAYFRSLIDPADVVHVSSNAKIPWWGTSKDDIHFNYNISGGNMMAMGTYTFAALRLIFDDSPEECLSCDVKAFTEGVHKNCDFESKATFRFPNGGIGEAFSTLKGETLPKPSGVTVTLKEVAVPDKTLSASQEKFQSRELTLRDFIHSIFWHRIDIKDMFEIRGKDGKVVKKWEEHSSRKVYTWKDAGSGSRFANLPGEVYWMSYRHQLEQFVNRIKGRKTQHWVSAEDSIAQMKMIDMAYQKSGLGLRPTSTFR